MEAYLQLHKIVGDLIMYTTVPVASSNAFLGRELPALVSHQIQVCKEIIESAQKTLEECRGQEADLVDQASNEEVCAEARRQKERAEKFLRELRGREKEIEEGTFDGCCEDCGVEIGKERLRTQLVTHHCVSCKECKEVRGVQYAVAV